MEAYNDIFSYLKTGKYPKHIKDQSNWKKKCRNFKIKENKLYFNHVKNGLLEVVKTKEQVQHILEKIHHEKESHYGVNKMRKQIVCEYYWKGIHKDVRKYVKKCKKCIKDLEQKEETLKLNKEVSVVASGWSDDDNSPLQFNFCFYMDILGPLIKTKKENSYIVVLTNIDTKWAEGLVLSEIDIEIISNFMYDIICRHGYPLKLLLSNSCLEKDKFHLELERFMNIKIKKEFLLVTFDSDIFTFNEEIKKLINIFITFIPDLKDKWDDHVPILMLSYNSFPNPNESPYFKTYNKYFLPSTNVTSSANEDGNLWHWTKNILKEFQKQ